MEPIMVYPTFLQLRNVATLSQWQRQAASSTLHTDRFCCGLFNTICGWSLTSTTTRWMLLSAWIKVCRSKGPLLQAAWHGIGPGFVCIIFQLQSQMVNWFSLQPGSMVRELSQLLFLTGWKLTAFPLFQIFPTESQLRVPPIPRIMASPLPMASTTLSITAGAWLVEVEVDGKWRAILAHFCLSLWGTCVTALINCMTVTVCQMK